MNHRERVLAALRHQEPDRIPVDFGGTQVSGIMALPYRELRKYLQLDPGITRVLDIYQYTAVIDPDIRELLQVDTLPMWGEPKEWRRGVLTDGSPAEFPDKFRPQRQEDGSQVVPDASGNILLKMPADGYYFDTVYAPLANAGSVRDIERCMDEIERCDDPEHLDQSLEALARKAKQLRETTDYLLIGYFGGHILYAAQTLRGWQTFLMDLLINQEFAQALMERLLEAHLRRFERFADTVGRYVDVVEFDEDLGMQDRPLMRPSLYRKLLKPLQKTLFQFAKSRCNAQLLLHTDGAVAQFFPDFIEMGIDAVNPIQVSAAGMDTRFLKKEFGKDMTFWGGGCDSQSVLPMGSPEQVRDEVKRRIDDLGPGGGFVFAPIHNVQVGVPPENVAAMFQTALEYGGYQS